MHEWPKKVAIGSSPWHDQLAQSIEQDAISLVFRTRAEVVDRFLEQRGLLTTAERRDCMDEWYDIALCARAELDPAQYLYYAELEAVRRSILEHESGLSDSNSWSEILGKDMGRLEPMMNLIYQATIENWDLSRYREALDSLTVTADSTERHEQMPLSDILFLTRIDGQMTRRAMAASFGLAFPVSPSAIEGLDVATRADLFQTIARIVDREIDDLGAAEISRWFNK